MRRIADGVLNLFYPETCIACGMPVARMQDCGICGACWERTIQLRIAGNICPSCGLPYQSFEGQSVHLCGKCSIALPPYSGARAFGSYDFELSRIIQALKFDGRRNLVRLLGPLLASTFLENWLPSEMDAIVPIPLHRSRKQDRGYNQAALLARSLARLLGLPVWEGALVRSRSTLPQVGLSDAERVVNVKHAFCCSKPDLVRDQRILLVDDVMTTGSTVTSACEALLKTGAARVSVLTVARAV